MSECIIYVLFVINFSMNNRLDLIMKTWKNKNIILPLNIRRHSIEGGFTRSNTTI